MNELESALTKIEDFANEIENNILGNGQFSANELEKKLQQMASWTKMGTLSVMAFEQKKNYYRETLGQFKTVITEQAILLKGMQGKFSGNSRLLSLLERYKKYENEVSKICGIIKFS